MDEHTLILWVAAVGSVLGTVSIIFGGLFWYFRWVLKAVSEETKAQVKALEKKMDYHIEETKLSIKNNQIDFKERLEAHRLESEEEMKCFKMDLENLAKETKAIVRNYLKKFQELRDDIADFRVKTTEDLAVIKTMLINKFGGDDVSNH